MFGVGSPPAVHSKVATGPPSIRTTSALTLVNSGESEKKQTNKGNVHDMGIKIWRGRKLNNADVNLYVYWSVKTVILDGHHKVVKSIETKDRIKSYLMYSFISYPLTYFTYTAE